MSRRTYVIVFLITTAIFFGVFGLVNFLNNQKLNELDVLGRGITADLLATETQFDLLATAPCDSIGDTFLSRELGELGEKLDFAQTTQGDGANILQLKKHYSLLQVRDYLLTEELVQKCNIDTETLLYFYANDCSACTRQGYVITEFKERFPQLRVYSFDVDLDFGIIDTFANLYNFEDQYPTIIVNGEVYQGFQGLSELEEFYPKLIAQQLREERIEQGRELILDTKQYNELAEEDIQFIEVQGFESQDIYVYQIDEELRQLLQEAMEDSLEEGSNPESMVSEGEGNEELSIDSMNNQESFVIAVQPILIPEFIELVFSLEENKFLPIDSLEESPESELETE